MLRGASPPWDSAAAAPSWVNWCYRPRLNVTLRLSLTTAVIIRRTRSRSGTTRAIDDTGMSVVLVVILLLVIVGVGVLYDEITIIFLPRC